MRARLLFVVIAVLATLSAASPAFACWDGFVAESPNVILMGRQTRWDVGRARALARYLPQIEALLARHDASAEVYFGSCERQELSTATVLQPRTVCPSATIVSSTIFSSVSSPRP